MWPTTIIFMVLVVFILAFTVIISHFAKFNPHGAHMGTYKPEFAYSMQDSREVLTNACKIPYIFLSNDDVVDGRDDFRDECVRNELNQYVHLTSDGNLTLRSRKEGIGRNTNQIESRKTETIESVFRCSYYKHSGISNQSFEIEDDKPTKVPFYNVAVTCKRDGIVEFLKPLVNFGVIPKGARGDAVALLFLPSINHKRFMKSMARSKKFMLENKFYFSKMMSMRATSPFQDLLLKLGVSSGNSVFREAKKHEMATFFSGPQQIRHLLSDVDYDTMDHGNFVSQFLIDENQCLEDGRRLVDDQLETFQSFLNATSGYKFFSTLFLDDYGSRKRAIDFELSEMMMSLHENGIFKNTTLVVASYDLSEKDVTNEDEKNPLLAVRLSDTILNSYPRNGEVLKMNSNRLLTSEHVHHLLLNLVDPNATSSLSPLSSVQSTLSSCETLGIRESMCICMQSSRGSKSAAEQRFLREVGGRFVEEVKRTSCVLKVELEDEAVFYEYSSMIKGDVRVVELSAKVTWKGPFGQKTLPAKKTFTFEPLFQSFRSFDSVRIIANDGVNVGISMLCFL